MQCLSCSEVIDDDSCFCDMCGTRVTVCASCKVPVAGKWCTLCGKPAVQAASLILSLHSAPSPAPAPAQPRPRGASGVGPGSASASGTRRLSDAEPGAMPRLRLRNKNLGIDLDVTDNATIGRTTGAYSTLFGSFDQVSSRHCCFKFDSALG